MKNRRIKFLILIVLFVIGMNSVYAQSTSKQFPWKKNWNRHQLYRMSIFYFEAGQAYEKKNKNSTAMHCYLHAANTSPYSDIAAKSRDKLRTKYNKNLHEPTIAELVVWLKKQPDLTQDEKSFIAQYERGAAPEQAQTPQTTPPAAQQPESQPATPAQQSSQQQPESQPATPAPQSSQQQPESQPATPAPQSSQQQPESQSATPAPQSSQQQTQTTPQNSADSNITDDEIRNRGERVRYRDDAAPAGN